MGVSQRSVASQVGIRIFETVMDWAPPSGGGSLD